MTATKSMAWAVLLLVTLGCTAAQEYGSTEVAGSSASPELPAFPAEKPVVSTDASERQAASAGYGQFWVVAQSLDAYPLAEWSRRLGAVSTEPLFPKLLSALEAQHASGVREYGRVLPRLVTVEIRGDIATIFDCQDASGAGEAAIDTGMPKTVGRSRTPIAASMRRGSDGHWRVSEAKELDSIC